MTENYVALRRRPGFLIVAAILGMPVVGLLGWGFGLTATPAVERQSVAAHSPYEHVAQP